jgi:hypothetical protein
MTVSFKHFYFGSGNLVELNTGLIYVAVGAPGYQLYVKELRIWAPLRT